MTEKMSTKFILILCWIFWDSADDFAFYNLHGKWLVHKNALSQCGILCGRENCSQATPVFFFTVIPILVSSNSFRNRLQFHEECLVECHLRLNSIPDVFQSFSESFKWKNVNTFSNSFPQNGSYVQKGWLIVLPDTTVIRLYPVILRELSPLQKPVYLQEVGFDLD